MERAETIKVLSTYDVNFDGYRAEEIAEAIDMAIDALQREDEFLKNLESNEPQAYDEDDCWNGRVPTHGRLIDADALSKKLCKTTIFIKDGEVFQRLINDAPTVQADRPHGEWIRRDNYKVMGEGYIWHCSICDEKVYQDSSRDYPHDNFCPNCGADMRGGK